MIKKLKKNNNKKKQNKRVRIINYVKNVHVPIKKNIKRKIMSF